MSKWDGGEGGGGEKKEREERRERGVRVNTAHFPFKHFMYQTGFIKS